MIYVTGSTELNVTNLNTISDFDAVVSKDFAGNSGCKYTTLSAALSAGHKNILVKAGHYTDNINVTGWNVRIVGATLANRGTALFPDDGSGPVFKGSFVVSGGNVILENLCFYNTTDVGLSIAAAGNVFVNRCKAAFCGSHGISVNTSSYIEVKIYSTESQKNNIVAGSSGLYISASNGSVTVIGCTFNGNGAEGTGYGLRLEGGVALVYGCAAFNLSDPYSSQSHGFFTASSTTSTLVGCRAGSNLTANYLLSGTYEVAACLGD